MKCVPGEAICEAKFPSPKPPGYDDNHHHKLLTHHRVAVCKHSLLQHYVCHPKLKVFIKGKKLRKFSPSSSLFDISIYLIKQNFSSSQRKCQWERHKQETSWSCLWSKQHHIYVSTLWPINPASLQHPLKQDKVIDVAPGVTSVQRLQRLLTTSACFTWFRLGLQKKTHTHLDF